MTIIRHMKICTLFLWYSYKCFEMLSTGAIQSKPPAEAGHQQPAKHNTIWGIIPALNDNCLFAFSKRK